MKKLLQLLALVALLLGSCAVPTTTLHQGDQGARALAATPVAANGALAVQGNRIVNQDGTPVQFKGMSLFWSQWSGSFWNRQAVDALAQAWGTTILRAALGVESGGYLTSPAQEKAKVVTVVDAAIANGLYVVIDWHDHNAVANKAAAKAFFLEMAQKYGKTPNVIFELFNEPDGETWPEIKAYAEEVAGVIRGTGSNNLIIVGTPTWSQDVDQAANAPITLYKNIAYTLHYYAATHKQSLRDKAAYALSKGIALMVTEFGTCEATGDGFVDTAEAQKWFDFLDANKISWMNWSLFDKPEAASALKPGTSPTGPFPDSVLTASGVLVKKALGSLPPPPPPPAAGFKIRDGKVLDANGVTFNFRGVNHAHTWYKDKSAAALPQIRAKGANAVRLVLSNGTRWTKDDAATVSSLVSQAKAQKLVSVLEVHDTTGYGEDGAATTLDQAADYWVSLAPVLQGQEAYVIINLANEPWGNNNTAGWTAATKAAVRKVRAAGLHHLVMIDAPNWGQDWSGTMKGQAAGVLADDPDQNLVFSVHMYAVYTDRTKVNDYLQAFASARLPLVVGEFANSHQGTAVPAADIMALAKASANGYLGWSWSGNGGADAPLDMVLGFDPSAPTGWGQLLFADLPGAAVATVFGGPVDPQAPTVSLTAPADGSLVVPGQSVTLAATAADADGTVAKVEFYAGTTLVGTDTTAPYTTAWKAPVTEGPVTLKAVATDNAGLTASSTGAVTVKREVSPVVTVTYTKNDWGTGFTANVRITNPTSTPISNWTLRFTFAGNQTLTDKWSAVWMQTGKVVSATPLSWNTTIGPNSAVEIGFNASYTGSNLNPTDFQVTW